jgi:multiple sugar transport system substrate-binding protein
MTYHVSRFPLAVPSGILRPFSDEELASVDLSRDDYFPNVLEKATIDGNLYGVPFDISTIVLYYNKDVLDQVGLLGDDGLPQGIEGIDNFNAALQKISDETDNLPLSVANEGATDWRVFYTLLKQQNGEIIEDGEAVVGQTSQRALETMRGWVTSGFAQENLEYPASIAQFVNGNAAFHINGVWELPTMVDGELPFEWGAVALPVLFDVPAYWADSHTFAIPNSEGNPNQRREACCSTRSHRLDEQEQHDVGDSRAHSGLHAGRYKAASTKSLSQTPLMRWQASTSFMILIRQSQALLHPYMTPSKTLFVPAIRGQLPVDQAVQMLGEELEAELR